MSFRDREKRRLRALKQKLFSEPACRDGLYGGIRRAFCLHEDFSAENLNAEVREAALAYFEERRIGWHDGKGNGPRNHLCCSQSCCVNYWFPFMQAPDELAEVLRGLGYDVDRMLPLSSDVPLRDGSHGYVVFEISDEALNTASLDLAHRAEHRDRLQLRDIPPRPLLCIAALDPQANKSTGAGVAGCRPFRSHRGHQHQ